MAESKKLPDIDEPLTDWEKALLEKFLSDPSQLPTKFKNWMNDYVSTNGSLHVSAMPTLKGEEWREVGATGQPSFENSWVNYDSATYQTAAFYRDALGVVHLKGLVKSGTIDTTAFTLPAGYRPPLYAHFGTISNAAAGGVRINTAGAVILGSPGSNTWVSLDGITFRAA